MITSSSGGEAVMVLSTCNRTEIYAFGNCPRDIVNLFCQHTGTSHELYYQHQNLKQNREAIEHLFRVGSGLESKILGDFEIIGQMKKSFQHSKELDAHNAFLERLINSCVQCSKKVKNETDLSTGAASVAFAAVMRVKEFMTENAQPQVLLLGTGKIGRTACENLVNQTGVKGITLINRTEGKAERLAHRFGVKHRDFNNLPDELNKADVVIVATGATVPTILPAHFTAEKKRLLLDLSMPRNVHPTLYRAKNFEVVDVDHLSVITQESKQRETGASAPGDWKLLIA
ncbi:MAG: glutamyl-tRNA reductase [Owenweeksia sp.]|nr:glutamyl-tRNA reductase [Owenweeksia sp.]